MLDDGDRAASPRDVKATHRSREIEKYKADALSSFHNDGSERILTTVVHMPQVAEFRTSTSYFFSLVSLFFVY